MPENFVEPKGPYLTANKNFESVVSGYTGNYGDIVKNLVAVNEKLTGVQEACRDEVARKASGELNEALREVQFNAANFKSKLEEVTKDLILGLEKNSNIGACRDLANTAIRYTKQLEQAKKIQAAQTENLKANKRMQFAEALERRRIQEAGMRTSKILDKDKPPMIAANSSNKPRQKKGPSDALGADTPNVQGQVKVDLRGIPDGVNSSALDIR